MSHSLPISTTSPVDAPSDAARSPRKRVVISGGGIAGLGAAIALREKYEVVVLEKDEVAKRGGGIAVTPQATRILRTLRADPVRMRALNFTTYAVGDLANFELREEDIRLEERLGHKALVFQWGDLRGELLRLATAPSAELGLQGDPATVLLGVQVEKADVDTGTVISTDGQSFQGDFIIAADGVNSPLRTAIVGQHTPGVPGDAAARVFIPIQDVLADEELSTLVTMTTDGEGLDECRLCQFTNASLAQGRDFRARAIFFPIHAKEYFTGTFHFSLSKALELYEKNERNVDTVRKVLEAQYAESDPRILKMIRMGQEISLHVLRDVPPLPTWSYKSKAVVIGDACHAVLPFVAQGAGLTLEDVEALAVLLPPLADLEGEAFEQAVEKAFREYERVRKPRATYIHKFARSEGFEEWNKRRTGAGVDPSDYRGITEYAITYKGFEAARRAMDGL